MTLSDKHGVRFNRNEPILPNSARPKSQFRIRIASARKDASRRSLTKRFVEIKSDIARLGHAGLREVMIRFRSSPLATPAQTDLLGTATGIVVDLK